MYSYFDLPADHLLRTRLWWIANIAWCILELFGTVRNQYNLFDVRDGIGERIKILAQENEEIKNREKQDERFARWLKQ